MSGWIKVEKSLESDPRTLRVARELAKTLTTFSGPTESDGRFDPCNALAYHYVTLVCGALARLWIYADTHIRDDDTLDMGAAEIDDWLGIPNFCAALPQDWLREIDEHTVELPGFQAHNGVEAKKKALTQKRVERHRKTSRNAPALQTAETCNAPALPDQTRPDQTRPKEDTRTPRKRGSTVPPGLQLTEAMRDYALKAHPDMDTAATFAAFTDYHTAKGTVLRDWEAGWRTWVRNAQGFGYARAKRLETTSAPSRKISHTEFLALRKQNGSGAVQPGVVGSANSTGGEPDAQSPQARRASA